MTAAFAAWHARADVAALSRELAEYSASGELAAHPALRGLMRGLATAQGFVAATTAHFSAALATEPLGEIPFRHGSGQGFWRLQLLQAGGATLSLGVCDPDPSPGQPETARFADCARDEIVLAGSARGWLHRRSRATGAIRTRALQLQAGARIRARPGCTARRMGAVAAPLLLLQLTRVTPAPGPICEYRLADGAKLREASGDKRASEQVMALAVLGAMQCSAARGPMAAFASDRARDRDARWEAARQLLALDSARGFALLCGLAQDPGDPLAAPARDLRDALARAHPALLHALAEPV